MRDVPQQCSPSCERWSSTARQPPGQTCGQRTLGRHRRRGIEARGARGRCLPRPRSAGPLRSRLPQLAAAGIALDGAVWWTGLLRASGAPGSATVARGSAEVADRRRATDAQPGQSRGSAIRGRRRRISSAPWPTAETGSIRRRSASSNRTWRRSTRRSRSHAGTRGRSGQHVSQQSPRFRAAAQAGAAAARNRTHDRILIMFAPTYLLPRRAIAHHRSARRPSKPARASRRRTRRRSPEGRAASASRTLPARWWSAPGPATPSRSSRVTTRG